MRHSITNLGTLRNNGDHICHEKINALIKTLTIYSDELIEDLDAELSELQDLDLYFYQNLEVAREFDLGPWASFPQIVSSARTFLDVIFSTPNREARQEALRDFVDVLLKCGVLRHIIPVFYGADFIEEHTKPFNFIHFSESLEKCKSIIENGFLGIEDPERLLNTKKGREVGVVSKEGYVYAYALKDVHSNEEAQAEVKKQMLEVLVFETENAWRCTHPYAVIGCASRGVEIYHKLDEENQTIIPIPCIETSSLFMYEC